MIFIQVGDVVHFPLPAGAARHGQCAMALVTGITDTGHIDIMILPNGHEDDYSVTWAHGLAYPEWHPKECCTQRRGVWVDAPVQAERDGPARAACPVKGWVECETPEQCKDRCIHAPPIAAVLDSDPDDPDPRTTGIYCPGTNDHVCALPDECIGAICRVLTPKGMT